MSLQPGLVTRDVTSEEWRAAAEAARAEGYDFFDWLSAVDQTDAEEDPGLDVVCHLMATGEGAPRPLARLLLRCRVPDGQPLASLTGLFAGAAWAERETHEMFGLQVQGFDDGTGEGLRPLLLPEGFEGAPLRKEFVLAARASKAWPGAKEPGEGGEGTPGPARPRRSGRRRLLPPGVPDPSWGPR